MTLTLSQLSSEPSTLPELLQLRARQSTSGISFLAADGSISKSLKYSVLLQRASSYSHHLRTATSHARRPVILSSFSDVESHCIVFWACCLAGILFCPLPPFHADPSRQAALLNYLNDLFDEVTLVTTEETAAHVRGLVPTFNTLVFGETLSEGIASGPAHYPVPSDPVCLMLTSGSTGFPKAVVLRHDQILSSCRGKTQRHGTSGDSRFLNWIAFDHVACLTEVHIHALLVDADQFHVAPVAVIQNPKALLDWCSTLRITYTFSPNFLLAQILRDFSASTVDAKLDLSSLRALISGGEAVPLKTAVAFADLVEQYGAPRNTLRAGFGMSETGAGSMYDTAPIPRVAREGAYLSLGPPCQGLNIRVMSPTGAECRKHEVGELQLSGPSVFREYYNNPSATRSAFTKDGWFMTGDLATVDDSGNVHLVGREKDCLNVNGVKLSTADVEHYVLDSQIKGIAGNGLYVCPMRLADAQTETYSVFYQHASSESDDELEVGEIRAINASIKRLCTILVSQSPHVVLPLPHSYFTKTSLGKVSRSQLSKAYLAGEFESIQRELEAAQLEEEDDLEEGSFVEMTVVAAISELFGVARLSVRRSTNIFDMGASSMHLMRLKNALQERLGVGELPTMELLTRPEVGALCDYLSAIRDAGDEDGARTSGYNPLVCFNASGSKPPVFLIHPGVGEVLVFINLARELAAGRPVYAIRARGFDAGDEPFTSLEETTEIYTQAIIDQYPSGPYYLAGYSYGGAIAFEVGKRLEARGRRVDWLGVLNLPPHIQFRMRELSWSEVLLNISMFLSLVPDHKLPALRDELRISFPDVAASDEEPADPLQVIDWLLERCSRRRLEELQLSRLAFSRWAKVGYAINLTGRSFLPSECVKGALTTIFCAIPLPSMGTREEFKRDRLSAWGDFSGRGFEMLDVDGEHYTMLGEEHVASFAQHMRGAIARAEVLASSS